MRAAVFIDGGYFLQQVKESGISPDYSRLVDYLMEPLRRHGSIDLLRCYFYYCAPWMSATPTEEELRRMDQFHQFASMIEAISRWQVRLGKLEKRRDGMREYFEQKRVDVLLSIDLVKHATAGHIQHAVLVAGDSDFIPAIESAKESGVTLTLWSGENKTVHKDLINTADEVMTFNWGALPKTHDPSQRARVSNQAENFRAKEKSNSANKNSNSKSSHTNSVKSNKRK